MPDPRVSRAISRSSSALSKGRLPTWKSIEPARTEWSECANTAMLAFDFYINGSNACTAGIDELGVLMANVTWLRMTEPGKQTKVTEELRLHVGGLLTGTQAHVTWFERELKVGDSVRIEIIDTAKVDRPRRYRMESARTRRKREQAHVLKQAAEWGWKIQK